MPVTTRSRSLSNRNHKVCPPQTLRRMSRSRTDSRIPLYSYTTCITTRSHSQKTPCNDRIVCEEPPAPRKIQTKRYNTRSSAKQFLELSTPEPRMITRSMTRFLKNYKE
jgi:hypothetical protein